MIYRKVKGLNKPLQADARPYSSHPDHPVRVYSVLTTCRMYIISYINID